VLTYWQKTHLKTPLIYLQHCHVDEYTATRQESGGGVAAAAEMRGDGGALDFRYNWSCLVRA
jgi:hypothetical protein